MRLTTLNPMPWIAAGFAYHWFGWHGLWMVVLLSAEVNINVTRKNILTRGLFSRTIGK